MHHPGQVVMPVTFPPIRALHLSLLLWVVAPLLCLSALAVYLGLNLAGPAQESRLKEDLELVARAVRLPIGESLATGNTQEIQNALDSVFSIGRVYGATVFDTDGDRIASVGTADSSLSNSRVAQDVVESGEIQERNRQINGQGVFSQFLPIYSASGQINGLIQITRRESDFDQATQTLNTTTWGVWVGAAGLMVLVVIGGHYRGVGRHVNRLLEGMSRVEHGDTSVRVAIAGPREMRDIGQALNRMLAGLEAAEADVRAHQESERQLNDRLQRQERMAAIGRVASGIAHELGAPLSVIAGRTRRLREEVAAGSDGPRQLDRIEQQVGRLNRMVRQLLDYCRPEGQGKGCIAPARLAAAARDDLQPELADGQVSPQLEVSGELPEVRVDEGRVTLALVNLLRNAVQAARSQVRLSANRTPAGLAFVVEDDGPGLDGQPEQLREPFYTSKPAGQGTGLGLAIVNNVALEHQGQLHLENRPEGGCRAELLLPWTQGVTRDD